MTSLVPGDHMTGEAAGESGSGAYTLNPANAAIFTYWISFDIAHPKRVDGVKWHGTQMNRSKYDSRVSAFY